MDTSNPVAPPGMFFWVKAGPKAAKNWHNDPCSGIHVELREKWPRWWGSTKVAEYTLQEHIKTITEHRIRYVMELVLGMHKNQQEKNALAKKAESLSGDYPPKKLS